MNNNLQTSLGNISLSDLIEKGINFGLKILAALVIIFVGFWVVGKITKIVKKILQKRNIDKSVSSFVSSLCNVALKIIVILMAIDKVGVQTTSIIAILGAAGLGIGMALSGTLQNFAGGIVLLLFKPFKSEDFIEVNSFLGTVKEIQIFTTVIKTIDNKTVFLPNSTLISSPIVNYTRDNVRRVDMDFGVAYGTNIDKAKDVIENIIKDEKKILGKLKHEILVSSLADSSVVITVRVWVSTDDYWSVKFDMNEKIYKAFNETGIEIPFPQVQVHMSKD